MSIRKSLFTNQSKALAFPGFGGFKWSFLCTPFSRPMNAAWLWVGRNFPCDM